ncbi:MAG: hypothetical protein E7204_03935 [Veillonella sp.]|nr:hypothetical protein [Veillonella sp.]
MNTENRSLSALERQCTKKSRCAENETVEDQKWGRLYPKKWCCCVPKSGGFLARAEGFENNRCQKVVFVTDFLFVVVRSGGPQKIKPYFFAHIN